MAASIHAEAVGTGFEVQLENFNGPFDLLLGLISKHELDITEIALARVTDEFISYIGVLKHAGKDAALNEASEFLVIAATLLDLKAARLLPAGVVEDEADVALLEERDLLFARLLQYRAFKEVAAHLTEWFDAEGDRYPRLGGLEPYFAALLPELVWNTDAAALAALATKAFEAREPEPAHVAVNHLHGSTVSVREQAEILCELLGEGNPRNFRDLVAEAPNTLVIVVRFLALLDLFRDGVVTFDQLSPLTELTVRWTAPGGDS